MILGHGIDVADLGRVKVLLSQMAEDFLLSTFTAAERETECLPEDRVPFFGGRLAAKEAVLKALGTGYAGDVAVRQVEIIRHADGSPGVRLRGAAKDAADRLGVGRWLISISHTETVAAASAIALKG
jgi:holo-[acyl-carrier protein] synthase